MRLQPQLASKTTVVETMGSCTSAHTHARSDAPAQQQMAGKEATSQAEHRTMFTTFQDGNHRLALLFAVTASTHQRPQGTQSVANCDLHAWPIALRNLETQGAPLQSQIRRCAQEMHRLAV